MSWLSNAVGLDGQRERKQAAVSQDAANPYSRDKLWEQFAGLTGDDARRETDAEASYGQAKTGWSGAIDTAANYQPTQQQGWGATTLQGQTFGGLQSWAPTSLQGYSSGNLAGVDTNGLAGYQAKNTAGVNTSGFTQQGSALAGVNPTVAASTGRLDSWNNADFAGFDPSQALNTWATGAWDTTKRGLADELDSLNNQNARSGRLNTGWFDKDRGKAITTATGTFQNALAGQALSAAQLRANVLGQASEQNLTRANYGDALDTQASLASAQNALEQARGKDAYATTGADLALRRAGTMDATGLDALKSATGYRTDIAGQMDANALTRAGQMDRLGLDQQSQLSDLGLRRATSMDQLGLDQARGIDSSRQQATEFGATQRGQSAQLEAQMYENAVNRRRDMYGSLLDQDTASRAQSAQAKQAGQQSWLNGLGAVAPIFKLFGG